MKILQDYPDDKENFFYIKDKILIYEEYSKVGYKCYSCKS